LQALHTGPVQAEASHHLVVDEQRAVPGGELAEIFEPARVGHDRLPRATLAAGEARHQREKRRKNPEGTGD